MSTNTGSTAPPANAGSGAVQNYQTDALQEHVDSTPLLINRLGQWSQAVDTVYNYVNGYLSTQNSITSNLEKTRKSINEVPLFLGTHDAQPTAQQAAHTEASHPVEPPKEVSLGEAFTSLQHRTDYLINDSDKAASAIKSTILPNLETLKSDIDAHFKTLRSSGQKGIKDVEKAREHTLRLVERLGRLTSSFGTQRIDNKDDPYVLHRQTRAAVVEQINRENIQAEAALNVQRSFASMEAHIVEVLQKSLQSLDEIVQTFTSRFVNNQSYLSQTFQTIDMKKEWADFTTQNKASLVPESNYQRDPSKVVFTNSTHQSTVPLIKGVLSRKRTVLKNYTQGYFVLTRSGFLHQFKSKDPQQEPTPELSLYLPDSGLGALPARTSGDLTFVIISKNAKRSLGTKHKYTFKASNYDELVAWYNACAEVNGGVRVDDDQAISPVASPSPDSPSSPVDSPMSPNAVPPASTAAAKNVPATAAPTSTAVPAAATSAPTTQAQQAASAIPEARHAAGGPDPTFGNF
ncbi:Cytoskeletal signaling protein slm1 [Wickerhamiella sorbophila]|uniref:Cytoskeletal signaling protein slm1 n=1 Tax=Wickerhamiella sorbophila TaxID=45607 RepID=A0A2T0FGK2_9ASCO|nr:Cytoskeletal signaling protein slm1 [Wickerhamiella sorbophila]PRT54132.1 Cytoskeletal signaling protein slm1 [Wickerhamiella sorbophila]